MLGYEWGSPSTVMLSEQQQQHQHQQQQQQVQQHAASHDHDHHQHHQIYDPRETFNDNENHQNDNTSSFLLPQQPTFNTNTTSTFFHHHQNALLVNYNHHHHHHDPMQPHAYTTMEPTSSTFTTNPHPHHLLSSSSSGDDGGGPSYFLIPKAEDIAGRIGLNLGVRTYFSSAEDHDFASRLYRRSTMMSPGPMMTSPNAPRCQAEGCNADLTHAKHYHRRHKVCEFHSKASTVIAAGLTQRFCQQCSRLSMKLHFCPPCICFLDGE